MSKNNRIYTFDNLKVVLIFFVIFHHCTVPYFVKDGINWQSSYIFDNIYIWTMTFTMPLFIVISGYFYKKHGIKHNLRKYLYPCVLISVVNLTIAKLSPAPFMSDRPLSYLGYAMWFLWVLFIYSIITPPPPLF